MSTLDLLPIEDITRLSLQTQQHYAALTSTLIERLKQRLFYDLFPNEDHLDVDGSVLIYARDRYPKHIEFFEAGANYRERCFLAANRVGKTTCGSYELICHLTGLYPYWWAGKRFSSPVRAWACGRRNETTRDIVQASLLGPVAYEGIRKVLAGTGMVPGNLLGRVTWKRGVEDWPNGQGQARLGRLVDARHEVLRAGAWFVRRHKPTCDLAGRRVSDGRLWRVPDPPDDDAGCTTFNVYAP